MLRPLGDRVLVRADAVSLELGAGLVRPEAYAETSQTTGRVRQVGRGFTHPAFPTPEALIGRRVLFSPMAGQVIQHGGEELLMLLADELLGIFEEETDHAED